MKLSVVIRLTSHFPHFLLKKTLLLRSALPNLMSACICCSTEGFSYATEFYNKDILYILDISSNLIKKIFNPKWPLVGNNVFLRNGHLRQICVNLSRRVTFSQKWPLASVDESGECRRVWRVRATRLGECRQVWRVTTSTRNVNTKQTRPRVLVRVLTTFAKFALAKFAVEWPLLSFLQMWSSTFPIK